MKYDITLMTMDHYDEVYKLWSSNDGVGLTDADSQENIEYFLKRNEGLSFIAIKENQIIGSILGSHDGRRGYIYHLAVDENYRLNGIGKGLVLNCLKKFKELGLHKTHIFVFNHNDNAIKFWKRMNYSFRNDISIMSLNIKSEQ
jgi:N-acetylglutamate synthase